MESGGGSSLPWASRATYGKAVIFSMRTIARSAAVSVAARPRPDHARPYARRCRLPLHAEIVPVQLDQTGPSAFTTWAAVKTSVSPSTEAMIVPLPCDVPRADDHGRPVSPVVRWHGALAGPRSRAPAGGRSRRARGHRPGTGDGLGRSGRDNGRRLPEAPTTPLAATVAAYPARACLAGRFAALIDRGSWASLAIELTEASAQRPIVAR